MSDNRKIQYDFFYNSISGRLNAEVTAFIDNKVFLGGHISEISWVLVPDSFTPQQIKELQFESHIKPIRTNPNSDIIPYVGRYRSRSGEYFQSAQLELFKRTEMGRQYENINFNILNVSISPDFIWNYKDFKHANYDLSWVDINKRAVNTKFYEHLEQHNNSNFLDTVHTPILKKICQHLF